MGAGLPFHLVIRTMDEPTSRDATRWKMLVKRCMAGAKMVWCADSPGWGGSEINLIRVWGLLDRVGDHAVVHSTPDPGLVAVLNQRRFTLTRQSSRNSAPWIIPGLAKAFLLILRFWRRPFVVWAHHSDSNRWLQVMLAATGRDFIVVE